MFTLGCDRAFLYAHPERELSTEERARYDTVLNERARGVPAQYITGRQEFWGMDLIVSPAVLIPRPETEHVIETVLGIGTAGFRPHTSTVSPQLSALSPSGSYSGTALASKDPGLRSNVRIVDVGTGSGCIALALAKELPEAELHATDISSGALEIARANAARHQLERQVQFHETDLLAGLEPGFDVVVSNPPYVGESEEDQVQLEVRKFEPHNAVFAGPKGTEVIERLIPQAYALLRPGGWLVVEISGTIASRVRALFEGWSEFSVTPDLQGIPRVAKGRRVDRLR